MGEPRTAALLAVAGHQVDSIVRAKMDERRIVGAAVVVIEQGRVLKRGAYGRANLATGEPVAPHTAFFVASIAKVVSAAAVMALADEGRLRLDESIGNILPGLPVAWRPVTVAQLVGHTSGLPDVVTGPGQYLESLGLALERYRDAPLRAPPGERYQYTQTNWALVGMIIEARSGRSFEEYVEARMFRPLGLRSPAFGGYQSVRRGRAEWYTTIAEPLTTPPQFTAAPRLLRTEYRDYLRPADGLFISAEDLARWVDALARGLVVTPASVAAIWTRVPLANGTTSREGLGGWGVNVDDGITTVFSGGGARASVVHVRPAGLTVVVLTNTQGAGEHVWIRDLVRVYAQGPR